MLAIELKFGVCYNVDMSNTLFMRVRHIGGGGGGVAYAPRMTHPMLQPQHGRNQWANPNCFTRGKSVPLLRMRITHFCWISYSIRSIEPKPGTSGHWHTTNIYYIPYFRLQMRVCSRFTFRSTIGFSFRRLWRCATAPLRVLSGVTLYTTYSHLLPPSGVFFSHSGSDILPDYMLNF